MDKIEHDTPWQARLYVFVALYRIASLVFF